MSIHIGIVGCGVIFPFHVEAINQYKDAKIIGIYDIDHEQSLHHNPNNQYIIYDSLEAMLAEKTIDVIHVLTPHHEHYPIVKEALHANKHVFVEKPFTITYKNALELVELADRKNKHLGVCFQHRIDQTTSYLKNLVDSKKYGQLTGLKGMVHWLRDHQYYNQALWRGHWATEGGGSLINQAIHTLDLMIYLGGSITDIKGTWMNLDHPYIEVDDNVHLLLHFSSHVKGLFSSSNSFPLSSDVQMEFYFEQAVFYLIGETLYQMKNGELLKVLENTSREGSKSYFGSGHIDLIKAFYDSITNNTHNYVRGIDALETTRVIQKIYTLKPTK